MSAVLSNAKKNLTSVPVTVLLWIEMCLTQSWVSRF